MNVILRLARRGTATAAAALTCGPLRAARALGSSLALGLFALLGTGCGGEGAARHEVSIPWALGGKQLVADLHMHSRYSDGALDADALVRKGYAAGCQVLALTDHSDSHTKAATAEYLNTLSTLRKQFPDRVLIGGLEWNVPPKISGIHMGVLFDPLVEQQMGAFKQRYEREAPRSQKHSAGWVRR